MRTYIQIILLLIVLIGLSCREEPIIPKPESDIRLTVEDVWVRDVSIRVEVSVSHGPWSLTITQDDRDVIWPTKFKYALIDTIYRFYNLQPNYTHIFKAYYWIGETVIDSSQPLYVTTMDTTSHNFLWDVYALGDGISNELQDVAIINDTCVYVVGEIFKRDSTGQLEYESYRLAKWDGKEWNLHKLRALAPQGDYTLILPSGIFAFSAQDVWFASAAVFHFDGVNDTVKPYWINSSSGNPNAILSPGQSISKLWGTSGNNLYAVGTKGAIAYFNGLSWQKIESGIDANISDIYGSINNKTGELEVIAIATDWWADTRYILKLNGLTVTFLSDSGIYTPITGIWFEAGKRYYITGSYVFYKLYLDQYKWFYNDIGGTYKRIRGNRFNDLVVSDLYGNVIHFNGYNWKNYTDEIGLANVRWYSVDMQGDMIVAGGDYGTGLVAIGRRE